MKNQSYSDYFEIVAGYYPEINEDSIKDPANHWQDTFPHEQIVKILEALEKILSRGSNEDKKNIWIDGAYGTGKSRVLWMMKSLLDCSRAEFEKYFDAYSSLKNKVELREKLLAAKKRKIITVSRYATGSITSTKVLIREIFDGVEEALRARNCKLLGAQTLRGKIAAWLEADESNMQLFKAKIRKFPYNQQGSFAEKSAEKILEDLKNPSLQVDMLIDDILKLGEHEGIRAFEIKIDDLKAWLTDVISANNLKAIVFFWDEFSSFFKSQRNNLDEFQKLIELANDKPFYMVIATQKAEDLLNEQDASFKTLRDRFKRRELTMPDNVAFELIADALKIKPAAQTEWSHLIVDLSRRTKKSREAVRATLESQQIRVSEKTLTGLLPIHPMAALMLKNISTSFASNQRSMFNFIKTKGDDDVAAFQRFISTNSPQSGTLLTVDYLWDFFYNRGKDVVTGGYGRDNLDESVRLILDSYRTYAASLNDEEQKVLKTLLILQAMTRKADNVDLFQPSANNLELAFNGIENFEGGRAVQIARNLVNKSVLFLNPGKIEMFAVMSTSIDAEAVSAIQDKIRQNLRTSALIASKNFLEIFNLTAAQKCRYKFKLLASDNFTVGINTLTTREFNISAVICFARDADDSAKMAKLIRDAVKNENYNHMVFIDATGITLNAERIERYIKTTAQEEYWRETDKNLSAEMRNKAADCLEEWRKEIEGGSFVIYHAVSSGERIGITCTTKNELLRELNYNVIEKFPLAFDNFKVSDSLYQTGMLRQGARLGIMQNVSGAFNTDSVKNVLRDAWNRGSNYFKIAPDLQISRLKIIVDNFISEQISLNVRVSFADIWALLVKNGFMPCNLHAFLTGFLLKEYLQDLYRYSESDDGFLGGAMTTEKLAGFISDVMSEDFKVVRKATPKYLEVLSKNQQAFMRFAGKVFVIAAGLSVEQCANKIRTKIEEWGYPLWCYSEGADDFYKDFFRDLEQIANPSPAHNLSELAERMGNFLLDNPTHTEILRKTLTRETARAALEKFLWEIDGGNIFDLGAELGVPDVISEIQKHVAKGEGAWLWKRDTAVEIIRRQIVDYKIIVESRNLGLDCNSWRTCLDQWKNTIGFIKIPCQILAMRNPSLRTLLFDLKEIAQRGDLNYDSRADFLEQLETHREEIANFTTDIWKFVHAEYPARFAGLNVEDIKKICAQLPGTSFIDASEIFLGNLTALIDRFKREQLKFELKKLWRELTQSESPREWSKKNRTPIFALVPDSERPNAMRTFEAVSSNVPETEISFAIEYLKSEPVWLENLSDANKVDEAFTRLIIGERRALLADIEEVRAVLSRKVSAEAYDWFAINREKIDHVVEEMAREKYYAGGANNRIMEKVQRMSAYKAKAYLLKLLKENYRIGIQLLAEEN